MEIKFLNQPKDIKLGEVLIKKLESGKFSRILIFAGFAKDSGVDYLLEAIKKAKESAYFLKLSKYQKKLEDYIESHPDFITPEARKKEMINNFIKPGVQDLCVSRSTCT